MSSHRQNSKFFARDALIVLVAAVAVTVPMYLWGIPYGNDMPQHYQFALQYENSLSSGVVYPSWGVEANGGLGDVGIRFYPPLPYYVLVLFKTLAGGWYLGSVFTFGFWFCLGGFGVYLLAREWFDGPSAVLAAAVFVVLPYHVNQIYNAFFYAEFAGLAVLPFCFLFIRRVVERKDLASVLGLAASTAILVLTHIPTSVMAAIALSVFALAELYADRSLRSAVALASAAVLGAAASSFYWIKLVTELEWVSHAVNEFTKTSYDFRSNFLAAYFYVGADDYISRSLWFADLLLLFTIALICGSLLVRKLSKTSPLAAVSPLICVAAVCVFLATPLSILVWQEIGPLQKIQFPFRFLGASSVCASVLAGSAFRPMLDLAASKLRPVAIVFGGLIVITTAFSFAQVIRPAVYRDEAGLESILAGRAEARSCECWWPVWARPAALDPQDSDEANGAGSIPLILNGVQRSAVSIVRGEGLATASVFYYPHWRLVSRGEENVVDKDESGRITLQNIDADAALVFIEPAYVHVAQIISGVAWLLLIVVGFAKLGRSKSPTYQVITK